MTCIKILRNVVLRRKFLGLLTVILLCSTAHTAEGPSSVNFHVHEMPPLPAPDWVEMVDQGQQNQELRGMRTPAGVRVDIVAREPVMVDPVGMAFDEEGGLYVLEWREATEQVDTTYVVDYQDGTQATVNRKTKNAFDHLKRLEDRDNDGVYDSAQLVMDDLEYPSSVLIHDSWMYFPSVGHVIRRRANGRDGFETQEILRGMCGYHHHQVSGLTLGNDGWLYTTTGDDDNRAEGSDGSRATVLRTGAIFRSQCDGSRLHEFARGFRNPYRNVVFDETFNMFHVDNDQEDGSKFQGVRLMHLLEGADYGWRLEHGAKCCRTDFKRGAVFGERPGKMPSMRKVGRGAPAGLLIYQQSRFPDFFRGLLIYPDCYRRLVRAYEVERNGSSFRITHEFVLMESDDDLFRPIQAVSGPDGAIYILDWHTDSGGAGKSWGDGKHGRLYRLSWSGSPAHPKIELGDRDAWRKQSEASDTTLIEQLDSDDFELRFRAQQKLVRRGTVSPDAWLNIVADDQRAATTRAVAIGAVAQQFDGRIERTLADQLAGSSQPDVRRLAAEALGHNAIVTSLQPATSAILLRAMSQDADVAVRRAAAIAAGSIAARTESKSRMRREIAAQAYACLLQDRRLNNAHRQDVWLVDGYVRAIERCGSTGVSFVSQWLRDGDDLERELAVSIFEAMRTRELVDGLDQAMSMETGLSDSQRLRLIETYRHILVEPPIQASGVAKWLSNHRQASAELRVAALQTLAMTGGDLEPVQQLAISLLDDSDRDVRLAAIAAIGESRMMRATQPLLKALRQDRRDPTEKRNIVDSLGKLRAQGWPYVDRSDLGVELVLPDLVELMDTKSGEPILADLLSLVGQVDLEIARRPAEQLLSAEDPAAIAAAIDVLGTEVVAANRIAKQYLNGEFPESVKANVAAALQRHLPNDTSGKIAATVQQLFQEGLKVTLDPAELARIDDLVKQTGDAESGKALFLDVQRSQCGKCHRLEGVGGDIGPDLTRIWQTHSVAKIIESIVEPSREIKEGFANWSAETKNGQVFTGLKISDTETEVVLRDPNGRDIRVPREQLESLEATKQSLMPVGTIGQLTFTELIDLLAFLKSDEAQRSLRQPTGAGG